MKITMMKGFAIALIAGAMGIGNAQAVGWPTPNIACTSANEGTTYDVQYFSRWEQLQITYYCNGTAWQLWQVCDLHPGGICVAY